MAEEQNIPAVEIIAPEDEKNPLQSGSRAASIDDRMAAGSASQVFGASDTRMLSVTSGITTISTTGTFNQSQSDSLVVEKAAQRKAGTIVLLIVAAVIAILAGCATGVIVYVFSRDSLKTAARRQGDAVVNGAAAQLNATKRQMEMNVNQLGLWVKSLNYNYTDPVQAKTLLNFTLFHSWVSRLPVEGEIYGFGLRIFFPVRYPWEPQDKVAQSGCIDMCSRPGELDYDYAANFGIWYDLLLNGDRDYTWATSSDIANTSYAYHLSPGSDGLLKQGSFWYEYNHLTRTKNGTFTDGMWLAPGLWPAADGSAYYYFTYQKMFVDNYNRSVSAVAWDEPHEWFQIVKSVIPTSSAEFLVLSTPDNQVLAFSEDANGDRRLRNCTNAVSTAGQALCKDIKANSHPHPFIRSLFSSYSDYIVSAAKESDGKWVKVNGESYLIIVRELWNSDQLRILATYAILQDQALQELGSKSATTVALCTAIVVLSALVLTSFAMAALRRTHKALDVVTQLTTHIAHYDIDGAQDVLDAEGDDDDLLTHQFVKIVNNLRQYRPFLPAALLHGGSSDELQEQEEERPIGPKLLRGFTETKLKTQRFKSVRGTVLHVQMLNLNTVEPSAATKVIREFLRAVMPIVSQFNGVVDTIQANSILATFNFHCSVAGHEHAACQCALYIRAALAKFPHLAVCMTLTTGFNLVGTCGTDEQKSRVVTGEAVDLVHRLSTLHKFLGCTIILTEGVAHNVAFVCVPLDVVKLTWVQQSRSKQFTIFELTSESGTARNHPLSVLFGHIRKKEYSEAQKQLKTMLTQNPEDFQSNRMQKVLDNCKDLIEKGYERGEQNWLSLEGDDFADKIGLDHLMAVSQRAESEMEQMDASHAEGARVKLEEIRSAANKPMRELDDGPSLFSVFVPFQGSAPKIHESQDIPKSFKDVSNEVWNRSGDVLGRGQYGEVYTAVSDNGAFGAVKAMSIADARDINVEALVREVQILSKLHHDHIAGYFSCAVLDTHFCIIMEYLAAGSLRKIIAGVGPLPIQAIYRYLGDMLRGLIFLHENDVVHCDIKPDNILFAGDGTCKLGDFGTAKLLTNQSQAVSVRGTPRYMSPEAALSDWTAAADMYSLGITIVEMFTGTNPWSHIGGSDTVFLMKLARDPTMEPMIPANMDPSLKALVQRCLNRNPAMRATSTELLNMM